MGELNLIQVCDHTVTITTKETTDVTIVRSDEQLDSIPIAGKPINIINVTDSYSNILSSDIYNLYGYTVVWIDTGVSYPKYRTPLIGESYIAKVVRTQVNSQSYSPSNCPKCGGHGWYVDIVDPSAGTRVIEGIERVAQEYLKCLLTIRGTDSLFLDYGTDFMDALGSDVADPAVRAAVSAALKEAENQVITNQSMDLTRDADSLLLSANLTSLIYDEEGPGFFIAISITTVEGTTANSNIIV